MTKWIRRWRYEMSATPVRAGVWRLKDGGYYVRARVTDRRTGQRVTVSKVLRDVGTAKDAAVELERLASEQRLRASGKRRTRTRTPFAEFAASLFEEKVTRGKLKSASTHEWWATTLEHYLVPAFGEIWIDELNAEDINEWMTRVLSKWMREGRPSLQNAKRIVVIKPRTANSWLRILRTICHAAKKRFELPKSAFDGIEFFPEPRAYTKEQPNALPPGGVEPFLDKTMELFPQFYAIVLLGFVTGLRPSSMRPLRRRGPEADIDWRAHTLEIRRSHSRGQEVMDATKTDVDQSIGLPPLVVAVLEWHVEQLTGKRAESVYLFPSRRGGLMARTALKKVFDGVAAELGLTLRVTPRGMRRTHVDHARLARLPQEVRRSISGHSTDKMEGLYSTPLHAEQRAGLEQIVGAMKPKTPGSGE